MRIWKWKLEITDEQTISMPQGAQVLTAQMQGADLQVWALVDETILAAKKAPKRFAIYGTGNPVPQEPGRYISTFQLPDAGLVFHVFEI